LPLVELDLSGCRGLGYNTPPIQGKVDDNSDRMESDNRPVVYVDEETEQAFEEAFPGQCSMAAHRLFQAVFQQQPVPESGDYFKADWIRYYDALPDNLRKYGASDYAVTDRGGDFTEHGVAGIDSKGDLYLIDWWYGQTPTDVWVDVFLDMAARHAPLAWAEEQGQIIKSLGPFIERRMNERGVRVYRQQYTSAGDKSVRAQAIRALFSMGKVLLPRNAPWLKHVVPQLLAFPAGRNDDAVDVLGLFGRMLDQMNPATASKTHRPRGSNGPGGWMG
jgi:predicted phage terminase large subunit-like protein